MSIDITAEELIKLLEETSKKRTKRSVGIIKDSASAKRFIKQCDIKDGTDRIPTFMVFYTYRVKWQGDIRNNKSKKLAFFKTFKKQFKQVRTGKYRYYLLDGGPFDMSKEGIEEAKVYARQEKKRQETLIKKKKRKISESKKGIKLEN